MKDLVFLEPNKIDATPFTTSEVIAEVAGVQHHTITRLIQQHESDFNAFGRVRFQIDPLQTKGGVQNTKVYHLNEQQATLLMTYLRNTATVRKFKIELVRQFYAMRSELMKRAELRTELKPIRRELTEVIKDVDNTPWSYKKYTDLAYKSALGMNAAQIRKDRNAPKKAKAVDYMTATEIGSIAKRQSQISVLLDMGLDYEQVKALVIEHRMLGAVSCA